MERTPDTFRTQTISAKVSLNLRTRLDGEAADKGVSLSTHIAELLEASKTPK